MIYEDYLRLQHEGSDWSYGSRWGDQMEDAMISWFAKQVENNAKILDVGCGEGRGVKALVDMGFTQVSGVDITPEKVNKGISDGLKLFIDDMHTLNTIADKEYDYVFTSHTLEHALSLEEVIKTLLRIIKKKIYFIIPINETKKFVEENNPSHTSFINDPKEFTSVLDQLECKYYCWNVRRLSDELWELSMSEDCQEQGMNAQMLLIFKDN
jgi:ubiquinone/menaquinone biosynthesis C-methylase UbiE